MNKFTESTFSMVDEETEIREKLKNWQQMVARYQKSDAKKAVVQMITSYGPYVALWVLMYFSLRWSYWITFGLAIVNAFFLVRIFIIQHDCGHQSFFGNKRLNNIVGYISSFFSSLPYNYWAKAHNFHHGHSGQLETRDIGDVPFLTVEEFRQRGKWGRFKYRLFRMPIVLFFIAPIYYFTIGNRWATIKIGNWKQTAWIQFKNNVGIVAVYAALGYFLGWKEFMLVQFTLLVLFGIIAFWFFYVQHQHENAYKQWKDNWDYVMSAIKGSTYYKLPRIFQWLTGNIGIHHIHHLSSLIPNYNLETCMKENPVLTKYVTTITFFESLKLMTHKLWDENRQRMITFREFYEMERLGIA